jgi:uncharacterized membrane protein YfcA
MLPGSLLGVNAGAHAVAALSRAGTLSVFGHTIAAVNLVIESLYALALIAVATVYWAHSRQAHDLLALVRPGPLTRVPLPARITLPRIPLHDVSAVLIAYLGLGLGLLSGLLGIGGGVALMPVLLYGFGFPFRQAAGTGIARGLDHQRAAGCVFDTYNVGASTDAAALGSRVGRRPGDRMGPFHAPKVTRRA